MLQFSSNRFRLFAMAFTLAAIVLASCSAQTPPAALATGTGAAQSASVPTGDAAARIPNDERAERLAAPAVLPAVPEEKTAAAQSEAAAERKDAAPAAVPDRTVDDKLVAQAPVPAATAAKKSKPAEPAPLEVAQLPPSAVLAVNAPTFGFAPDDAGRLIAGYFGTPRPIAAATFESRAEERAWPRSAEWPPRDVIPAAEYDGPRVIPLERVVLVSLRPVVDLAPLGIENEISRPERPSLPLAPKTALAGPNPQQLPDLPLLGRMDEGAVTLLEDATAAPLLRSLLSPLGSLRTGGIPFLPPPVLDPLAHIYDFELKNPPADNDPPARPTTPLPAPVLP
jgi:hypothetical protein